MALMNKLRRPRPFEVLSDQHAERLIPVGGIKYVRVDGDEYQLGGEQDNDTARASGGPFLSVPIVERDGSKELITGNRLYQLHPVPRGSHAAAVAKAQAKRRGPAPVRLVDGLTGLHLLGRRLPMIVASDTTGSSTVLAAAASARPATGYDAGRGVTRGRAILTVLERKGIHLEASGGRLLVRSPGGRLTGEEAEVISRASRLLLGFLGDGAPCELGHPKGKATPEAVTVLLGGALACAAHLSGELE
jgi:hypothetical protein